MRTRWFSSLHSLRLACQRVGFLLTAAALVAGCEPGVEGPSPKVISATPDLVCSAQRPTEVTLTGSGFSPTPVESLTGKPQMALPVLSIIRGTDIGGGAVTDAPVSLNGDQTVATNGAVRWVSQSELRFVVDPALALPQGQYAVEVTNPTGGSNRLEQVLTIVDPPVLRSATPTPICTAQYQNAIALEGDGFLVVRGVRPTVLVDDLVFTPSSVTGCAPVATATGGVERCTSMVVELPQGSVAVGAHAITVVNPAPADCRSSESVSLFVAPPPSVGAVTPQPVCLEEGSRQALVRGQDFLTIGGAKPSVSFGGVSVEVVSVEGCEAIDGLIGVERCTELSVLVAQDALPPGLAAVVVTNPETAQCASTESVGFAVVPSPSLDAVAPQPLCNAESERTVTLTGSGFLFVGDAPPAVQIAGIAATGVTADAGSCEAIEGVADVRSCTSITAVVPQAAIASGIVEASVTNPDPAGCSTATRPVVFVPPPTIDLIAPEPICVAQSDTTLTISGTEFLVIAGALPTATVTHDGASSPLQVSVVDESCVALDGVDAVRRCSQLSAIVPQASLSEGETYDVAVQNPEPAGCTSAAYALEVAPPPAISSVAPLTLCTGGGTFTVGGTSLFGVGASLVDSLGGVVEASNLRVNETGTEAVVSFAAGLSPETYVLNFDGQGGCSDAAAAFPIRVVLGPVAYYLDPPATYGGVAVRATIYVSGVTNAPDAVVVTPAGGGDEVPLSAVAWDPASPNIIRATIPASLAGGQYDLFVRGVGGCDAFLAGGLTVVTEALVAMGTPAVQPGFGEAGQSVAVNIYAKETPFLLPGEVNFTATPRAYLSSAALSEATPVRAVAFDSSSRLTAVVPPLAEGTYDLIIVNPDNTVGFVAGAYRATTTPPPIIDDLSPTQIENDTPDDIITIRGQNLGPIEVLGVELDCLDPGAGVITTYTAPVLSADGTTLLAQVPDASQNISNGSVCVVRVRNTIGDTDPSNDIWDEFSALTVTNPAAKLAPFSNSGTLMVEPRRAAAAAIGRATREARFLYAIGGDDGDPAAAKTSVEAAPLGRFGDIGSWRVIDAQLPRGTTLATAYTAGDFVWLLGGMKEGIASNELLRAQVLKPLDGPQIASIDVRFFGSPDADPATRDGLEPGAWSYAVAAVFSPDDPNNPGGESLPSELRTLYTPDVPDGIETELGWLPVFGSDGNPAVAYRIYRTVLPNEGTGALRLLAEVTDTRFIDRNPLGFADVARAPLQTGDLGQWRLMPQTLATPRASFGFVTAQDPTCETYWYLVGGITDAATESSSYDLARFDSVGEAPEAFTAVTVPTSSLAARREHSVFVANTDNAPSVAALAAPGACNAFLYAAYGVSGAGSGTFVTNARVAPVESGGILGAWASAVTANNTVAGAVSLFAADGAYLIGGRSGAAATADAVKASMRTAPQLGNWSDAVSDLSTPRFLPGSARVGAFLYFVGGWDGTAPLASAEFNVR